jgi:transcriptional regulator with PAS, ATPase and Fis domain
MFGTEPGAYTGAVRRLGALELAGHGTLFLDEIGELPLLSQVKLLRALEGSFHRVGGSDERRSHARIIAATNSDLQSAIRTRAFREDLYFRINVLTISIPPLRKRREDIPLLVEHFARDLGGGNGEPLFGADALARLSSHEWRGNVRELRNVVHRALVCAESTPVRGDDIHFG